MARFAWPKGRNNLLLIIPIISTGLGIWQIKRYYWKQEVLSNMQIQLASSPTSIGSLPNDSESLNMLLESLKTKKIRLKGSMALDQETDQSPIFIGPRPTRVGVAYAVIEPFVLDSGQRVLVNRGLLPRGKQAEEAETSEEILVLIDPDEKKPFGSRSDHKDNIWGWKDINGLAEVFDTLPICFRQVQKQNYSDEKYPRPYEVLFPIPNRHIEYIFTWFGVTLVSTIITFLKK